MNEDESMTGDDVREAGGTEVTAGTGTAPAARNAPVAFGRDTVVRVSDDVVARHIEGEIIIVPLVAGIGDLEDELYTLNQTGQAIWDRIDGVRTLGDIATELADLFSAGTGEVERDVVGLCEELIRRGMLVVV